MPSSSEPSESPSRSSRSTPYVNLAERIPWERLPAGELETLREIAVPISVGLSEAEIAARLGVTVGEVRGRMDELRATLLRLAGETPDE